ncbi:Uncharacterised protein [Bacteroides ovatus]|nr:hypothetical protein Bovatus_02560 [Bacteroides ovatus]CAG9870294.1 hypothetical protein BOVAC1_4649 [Bacteroides ovatus]CAG9929714.1 hypothetical protein BOVA208_3968 [Bacteroides ovatus]SDZ09730.1 hypothetical protein SAMN05444282_106136 [Bacteroides ovatus]SQA55192.1 Uncharacterised protein [Bacteroides ovatus]
MILQITLKWANPCLLELAHLFTANFNLINTWSITLQLIPYI